MAIILPEGPEIEQDPLEFLDCLLHYNQGLSMELIVATAWGIWKRRCDSLHSSSTSKKIKRNVSFMEIKWAITMVEEFKAATTAIRDSRGLREC